MHILSRTCAMAAVVAITTGCVPLSGGWDVDSLSDRHPEAMNLSGQRLGDTPPYFVLHDDSAVLFLCRFSKQTPISVSLPSGVTKSERTAIRVALSGWENAGLGIQFDEVMLGEPAMIEIYFAEAPIRSLTTENQTQTPAQTIAVIGTGYTVSDCGFEAKGSELEMDFDSAPSFPVHLTGAIVHLRRSNTNMLGQEIMLSVDELVGVALHELGHALGFPGHVATTRSVMSRSTDSVRRFGRNLLSGGGFSAPSLVALYDLPSGIVVGRVPVGEEDAALFGAAVAFAEVSDWQGPFVRVGESSANLNWRSNGSIIGSLDVRDYQQRLLAGSPLVFSPSTFERALRTLESSLPPATD
jgi:hypothetical protein